MKRRDYFIRGLELGFIGLVVAITFAGWLNGY
jgi:hypothetical protein